MAVTAPPESIIEGPPLKPMDRLLRKWRFAKARPFIPPGSRVLDIGCADGALFRYLQGRASGGVGLDPTLRRPVNRGSYRLLPRTFPGGLEDLGSFDVITMLATLEHMPERQWSSLRAQCFDLLRPGGRMVITVPSPAVDRILHLLLRMRVIRGMGLHEHHGFDPSDTRQVFPSPGFRLVRKDRFQLGLNNLFVFERVIPPAVR
jgi:SAM-dependent methyltransferase